MPRGRGNNRGSHPSPRGRGRGRGRGFRGAFHGDVGGMGGTEGALVFEGDFADFNLDHVMPPRASRGPSPAHGRGGYRTPPRGFQPRGGRGARMMRGIGFSPNYNAPRQRSYLSLSALERDRPLLRPVNFVRAEHQKTLFQEVEEILHAPGQEGGDIENHAPSADVVERIFKTSGPVAAEVVSSEANKEGTSSSEADAYDEPIIPATDPHYKPVVAATEASDEPDVTDAADVEETTPAFIIDTSPSPFILNSQHHQTTIDPSIAGSAALGESVIEEEVIVYVAPHPRTGHSTPIAPSTPLCAPKPHHTFSESSILSLPPAAANPIDDVPLSLPSSTSGHGSRAFQAQARTRFGLKPTPRSRKIAKKERAAAKRRAEREAMFDSAGLGLGMEELKALQHGVFTKDDTRKAERRRGDSDVEWGTDDESGIEEVRSALGDMGLDPEGPDMAQLEQFARGVPGLGGNEVITIADLEDTARMEEEDENEATDEDASDLDDSISDADERRETLDSTSSGTSDEESPRRGFQARLRRMREKAKGKAVVDADTSEEDSDDDGLFAPDLSRADRDDSYLEKIQNLLDENDELLHGRDRKARKELFKTVHSDGSKYDGLNMRKKDRVIPSNLRDQWARDRAKKAERKYQRALARMESTAEYSMRKSLGKKKQENIFGSIRFEGETFIADRTSDMVTLEQQIRTFIDNLELKTMILPAKSKEWRRQAHLLAEAFNLKSKSKGKGEGRFTTLIKTTRSGVGVNERKISWLVRGNKGEGFQTPPRTGKKIRNREGEEVGKTAPKLSETNVGFRLLQQMGWEEGDRIGGATGGLVDPLTAIIKTTKLGLGASR